jgi:hypothetical protein
MHTRTISMCPKKINNKMVEFSVIIPWADRSELQTSLVRNWPLLSRHEADVVVVNAGGDCGQLDKMLTGSAFSDVRPVHLPRATFNRSMCMNVGASVSVGRYMFLLDADIVLSSDIFDQARPYLEEGSTFVAVERILESDPVPHFSPATAFLEEVVRTTELITVDGRRAVTRTRVSPSGRIRNGDGLVLVKRMDFLQAGGLNSKLVSWGYEDTDFQLRLQFLLGLSRTEVGEVIHITHTSDGRSAESWQRNQLACSANYKMGRFLGTLEDDIGFWKDKLVEIPPPVISSSISV